MDAEQHSHRTRDTSPGSGPPDVDTDEHSQSAAGVKTMKKARKMLGKLKLHERRGRKTPHQSEERRALLRISHGEQDSVQPLDEDQYEMNLSDEDPLHAVAVTRLGSSFHSLSDDESGEQVAASVESNVALEMESFSALSASGSTSPASRRPGSALCSQTKATGKRPATWATTTVVLHGFVNSDRGTLASASQVGNVAHTTICQSPSGKVTVAIPATPTEVNEQSRDWSSYFDPDAEENQEPDLWAMHQGGGGMLPFPVFTVVQDPKGVNRLEQLITLIFIAVSFAVTCLTFTGEFLSHDLSSATVLQNACMLAIATAMYACGVLGVMKERSELITLFLVALTGDLMLNLLCSTRLSSLLRIMLDCVLLVMVQRFRSRLQFHWFSTPRDAEDVFFDQ
mmetsp:Transcript_29382/g.73961  ORF Transcript_29382/g.73961 Transcript_29382/m.73961 type:complete len:397 (+) Transcript_29382:30-1220(+)|eukprot:CAMPEP_0177688240 /NCGR_PEP_ID=MMETSP0447-20121125/34554_1 /TAXON_ID=0 /ORGANISM="Stygamoeba regulata, Strain BSH-02190019" /LENGTH=396 /DNA_ID=CAMNT_0019198531 /DNA_START=29 /DNA_END=1219 /DNA_ORIENTATION=-